MSHLTSTSLKDSKTKERKLTFEIDSRKRCDIRGDLGVHWEGSEFRDLVDFDVEFLFYEEDQKSIHHDVVTFQSGLNGKADTIAWEAFEIMIRTVTGCKDIGDFCALYCNSF
tara:strand:+ start:982 stop:1317 length:336 start_codon:yes stop_codon:yes gene_type:complete